MNDNNTNLKYQEHKSYFVTHTNACQGKKIEYNSTQEQTVIALYSKKHKVCNKN